MNSDMIETVERVLLSLPSFLRDIDKSELCETKCGGFSHVPVQSPRYDFASIDEGRLSKFLEPIKGELQNIDAEKFLQLKIEMGDGARLRQGCVSSLNMCSCSDVFFNPNSHLHHLFSIWLKFRNSCI